ncbi:MAG: hypothetical protein AB8B64_02150 [Granulosicoccus sp.]
MKGELEEKPIVDTADRNVTIGLRAVPDPGRKLWVRCLMQVLWPAFLGAALTVGFVFSMIDPMQIDWAHNDLLDSPESVYTAGFLLFWVVYTLACAMTWFLATTETPSGRM